MKNIWAIYKRELGEFFVSPVAYALLVVFALIGGFFFFALTTDYLNYCLRTESNTLQGVNTPPNVNEMLVRPLFSTLGFISLLLLPMVSMRLLSQEKRQGSLQLLLTSPVSSLEIVLGKYFAALTVYITMLGITVFYLLFYFLHSTPDWQPVLVGYAGMLLLGAAFLAVGTLISSCTQSPIISAALTFGFLLLFWVLQWAGESASASWQAFFTYLSPYEHHQNMTKGIVDTRDILYFVSLIFLGIFLAKKRVETFRWK